MSDKNVEIAPNDKEIKEFVKERKNIYKGTFVVCLVYGLMAVGLLLAGAFTDFGREYIFGKMLPATATFVFGALFIVLYLAMSIYDLKPVAKRTKQDADNGIICPDYWKLERVDDDDKGKLKDQAEAMKAIIGGKDFQITDESDPRLDFKCKLDTSIQQKNDMKEDNARYYTGWDNSVASSARIDTAPQYLFVKSVDTDKSTYRPTGKLASEYAKLTGFYDSSIYKIEEKDNAVDYTTLSKTAPLKCTEVYPRILEDMDKDTPEKNKYRCEYAKACDIPWTNLGCKYNA